MPWMAIILAVLTYLLQNPKSAEERRRALLASGAVGLGTYYVSENTEWGKENVKPLDEGINDFLGISKKPATPIGGAGGAGITDDTKPANPKGPAVTGQAPGSGSESGSWFDGVWKTLQSWGGLGTASVIGAGTVAGSGAPSWLKIALIGGGLYLVLK